MFVEAYGTLRVVASAEAGGDAAEDVVQQAAIVAFERLDRFTPGTNFTAWMAAIVRNVARNHRRSEGRRRRRLDLVRTQTTDRQTPDAASPSTSLGGVLPAAEAMTAADDPAFDADLRAALDTLEELPRACLLLRVVSGHSYREIGAILELPEATARSHVHRGRRRLLDQLERAQEHAASPKGSPARGGEDG